MGIHLPDPDEDGDFEPIPEGTYNVTFYDIEKKEGKKNDYLFVKFKVQNGEQEGETVVTNLMLGGEGAKRTSQVLRKIRPDFDFTGREVETEEIITALQAEPAVVKVKKKEHWDDPEKEQNVIEWGDIYPADDEDDSWTP